MEQLFNALLTYEGEGELKVYLPRLGETSIYRGKPMLILNATQANIEYFRTLSAIKIRNTIVSDPSKVEASVIKDLSISSYESKGAQLQKNMVQQKETTKKLSRSEIAAIRKAGESGRTY